MPLIKHDLIRAGLLTTGLMLVIFFSLTQLQPAFSNLQWLLVSSVLYFYMWLQAWRGLERNRADQPAPPYPTFGLANHLTLVRGSLIAMTGGFLWQPQTVGLMAWMPGLLYGAAAILDRIDGFVARRTQRTSVLGSELDTAYDALGLIIAPLLAWSYAKVHWSFLFVSGAFYIFQWGLYWRRTQQLPIYPLLPSQLRRTLAGFQMGCIALILLPCFHANFTLTVGLAFTLPILLGFIFDWLIVSGRIPSTTYTLFVFQKTATVSAEIFQPLLRVLLCNALLVLIFTRSEFIAITTIFLLLAGAMVALGYAGRIGAGAILLLLGWQAGDATLNSLSTTIIFSSAWLLLLGTGKFSLWQGDDRWVNRRDGEETN